MKALKAFIARFFRKVPPPAPSLIHVPEGQHLFRCFAHGTNFPGAILSLPYAFGFYTTRYIVAVNAEAAEMAVLEALRTDPALQLPPGVEKTADARVYFEKIEEVPNDTPLGPNEGFTFYRMDT